MFERYTERARRVLFFARYEATQLGSTSIETEHLLLGLIREGKGPDEPDFRPFPSLAREHQKRNRRTHGLSREGVHLGGDSLQRRDQARAAVRGRRGRPAAAHLHRHRTSAPRHPARGTLGGRRYPVRQGDAARQRARGHRPAPQREDGAGPPEGDAASCRVQPRPQRGRRQEPARPARRTWRRARASPAGALPAHEEQRRADWRAWRRQDRHRRRVGPEDRLRRRAALSGRQASPRARHLADRRRHEVSRPVRGTAQGDHEGAHREPEHHRVHR